MGGQSWRRQHVFLLFFPVVNTRSEASCETMVLLKQVKIGAGSSNHIRFIFPGCRERSVGIFDVTKLADSLSLASLVLIK